MRMTECSGLMRKKRYKVGNEGGGFRGYVYCVSSFIFICVRIEIGRKNKRTKQGLGTRDRKSGQGSLTVTNGVFPFCPSGCANHIPNTYLSHTNLYSGGLGLEYLSRPRKPDILPLNILLHDILPPR